MIEIDPSNPKWQMEGIYADTNLGVILNDEGRYDEAAATFEKIRNGESPKACCRGSVERRI